MLRIDWSTPQGELTAVRPDLAEVTPHVAALTAAYNDPHNAALLGHTSLLEEQDVLTHYETLLAGGAHPFLLYCDGALAGDGDLRNLDGGAAEFAFLIAAPSAQGKGLGTRFAIMVHAFAFARLDLAHVYASIVPANTGSRRVFEKLGYQVDTSEAARGFADDPDDIIMSIDRATFASVHAEAMAQIRITMR
ncbi:MAG: GNAT family N-acetyltransferase [Kofleriaceae bacterium]|nr:GNAT family N-acetyltransferase [Kofleriaceae bacterium]